MLKNYFKLAFRNLMKNKTFTFINITGFAVGIASCILILLFVQDELSYDRFHEKADRIYRVTVEGRVASNEFNMAVSSSPMGRTLISEFPEVETATRVRNFGFPVFRYNNKAFSEENVFWVDSTFFNVFSCEFIQGKAEGSLTEPRTIVLTESMAKKYFGEENPIGKLINSDKINDFLVTAVIKDFPANSHFHPEFLASLYQYPDHQSDIFVSNNYFTYFVLNEKNNNPEEFEPKLELIVEKYCAPQIQQFTGTSFEELKKQGTAYGFKIEPLTDIHLYSKVTNQIEANSDAVYVYIFSIIAFTILLIACINFMNLSTARSVKRSREVGIRKTLGSSKGKLIQQFLSESVFMTFIAVLLSFILITLLLPFFNQVAGKELELNLFTSFSVIPFSILFALVVGVLAGLYPAFFLASFQPVKVLRGDVKMKGKGAWLRSALVIFQFAVSVILFVGTFVVYGQLQYIQSKKLGFEKDQILLVEKTDDLREQVRPFMLELKDNPNVISVSNSNTVPGRPEFGNSVFMIEGANGEETYLLNMFFTDYDFAKTYTLEISDGRFFSEKFPSDSNGVIVNERAVKAMGIQPPVIGKNLINKNRQGENQYIPIVGVVKDFHYQSLHDEILPMVIFPMRFNGRCVSVKLSTQNIAGTINFIEQTWRKYASDQAFEYTFLDEDFAKNYKAEQATAELFTGFSILAIIIACLGLFGMATFITQQRTKEIGIRKVLGADISGLLFILVKQFSIWVIIANIIAWPIAYWAMDKWLQDFTYKIEIGWWVFITAGIIALFISMMTVSSQVVKVAVANPVKSLRYE